MREGVPARAVDHAMKDEILTLEVGKILVATGYELFDARASAQYGYGGCANVFTSLEFERMINAAGRPAAGSCCETATEPRAVAIVHCVGSRDENYNRYCSRVCCMTR